MFKTFSQILILLRCLVWQRKYCAFTKPFSFLPGCVEKLHCLPFRIVRQGNVTEFWTSECVYELYIPILFPKISMQSSMLTHFFQKDATRITLKLYADNGRLKYRRHLVFWLREGEVSNKCSVCKGPWNFWLYQIK